MSLRWRVFLVVAVLAGAAVLVTTRPVRLGLDLRGGTQIVLEAQDTARQQVDGDTVSRTLEVLRRRVDALGVAEPSLQRSGDRRIIVELPGLDEPEEAVEVIGRTAQLEFRPVLGVEPAGGPSTEATAEGADEELVVPGEEGELLRLGPPQLTGDAVGTARARFDAALGAAWQVEVDFRGSGKEQWAALTGEAACYPPGDPGRRVAIVLDREVISSPQVSPEIGCGAGIAGGETVITGGFGEREAKDLALLIRAGALPVPVEVVEQRTIGPTLGDAAIRASVLAALIGAACTMLYIVAYYRLLGLLAALALVVYGFLAFAALLALDATLTLPGIAGFVLAIGMAVDANVLVFERAKEEWSAGRSVRRASLAGFRRAWTAILDSNVTTVLAAGLLFFYASGGVRGFGITLTIGVAVSMFTALVVTRVLVETLVSRGAFASRPGLLGFGVGERLRTRLATRGPDLMGRARWWFLLSAVVVAVAVAGIGGRGLTYGVEFSGGRLVEYDTTRDVDLDALREGLAELGLARAVVNESGDGNVSIRTAELSEAEEAGVEAAVVERGGAVEKVRDEFVGPTIGDELRRRAAIALGLALVAQLVYLAVRFRWTWGTAAVVAMFHDVVILLGVFAWLGKTLDGVFLASLLTVIGYSINDSVVVFDRIREERRSRPKDRLNGVANDACLQTLPRTVNTGMGAVFILVALYVLGGETLTDFALALLIGLVTGTYSSVFTAAPLGVALERRRSRESAPPASPRHDRGPGRPSSDTAAEPEPVLAGAPSGPSPSVIAARARRKRRGHGRRR